MSTTTTNYGLIKPELPDIADITEMNPNWDTIDIELKNRYHYIRKLTSSDDLNLLIENGIYYFDTGNVPSNSPYNNASIVEVTGRDDIDTNFKLQRVTRGGSAGYTAFRTLSNGTWLDWSFVVTEDDLEDYITIDDIPSMDLSGYLPTSGGEVTGTLVLSKTTEADGANNNNPALIVGGNSTSAHLEFDANEIIAKQNGTTLAPLYLQSETLVLDIDPTAAARVRNIYAGTSDMTAGTTTLNTGRIYLVYE